MILKNEQYEVKISVDPVYTINSTDNAYYNLILNPDHLSTRNLTKTLAITVTAADEVFKIALTGHYHTYDTDCGLLEANRLTVLQNTAITQIDLSNFSIAFHRHLECSGCNFGIYQCIAGYVIYGEIEIVMLNFEFEKKWSFSGREILVTQNERAAFELCDDRIKLWDWENNYYELDFDGSLISLRCADF